MPRLLRHPQRQDGLRRHPPTNATTRKVGRGEAAQLRLRQARLTGVAAPLAGPVVFRTTLLVRREIRLSARRQAPRLGPIDV
jgi:hypothetical protein